MPTFNRAYIIRTAVQSILDQTDPDWELLVVDDGSTDDTERVIGELHDRRIRYIKQSNQGAAAARNHGLAKARGTWIAYLDSDNEISPKYLQTMHAWLARKSHAVFAIPRAHRTLELYKDGKLVKLIDDSADTPPGLTLKDIFMLKLHLDTNGLIHHRRVYDEGIRWNTTLPAMEDWDFAMTIGEHHPDGFVYVEEVLYNYHQRFGGDGVVSNSTYGTWADVFEQMYELHKQDKLLEGQTWNPARVKKWRARQHAFEAGKLPPYHLYYFQD